MGLLDKLRQESETIKKAELTEKERVAELERVYAEKVSPKLEKIYSFLKELEQHLNFLNPDVRVNYEVPGLGVLVGLKQGHYEMDKSRSTVLQRVPFRFTCVGEDPLKAQTEGVPKVNAILEELNRAKVRFESKSMRNNNDEVYGAKFIIYPKVQVTIMFIGVLETGGIELYVNNYDNLSRMHSLLNPAQITDEFLEELGKFILREPNLFLKNELSAHQKAQLAEMVRQANEERDKELREAEEREKRERALLKNKKLK